MRLFVVGPTQLCVVKWSLLRNERHYYAIDKRKNCRDKFGWVVKGRKTLNSVKYLLISIMCFRDFGSHASPQ